MEPPDLFQEWREADRRASAAEQQLLMDSMKFVDGRGEDPTQAQRDMAKKLRGQANDLFVVAMEQLSNSRERLRRS